MPPRFSPKNTTQQQQTAFEQQIRRALEAKGMSANDSLSLEFTLRAPNEHPSNDWTLRITADNHVSSAGRRLLESTFPENVPYKENISETFIGVGKAWIRTHGDSPNAARSNLIRAMGLPQLQWTTRTATPETTQRSR